MHIILGGTGHVGSAVANALLELDQPVTIITRDPRKSDGWQRRGAEVAIADVHDVAALRHVFRGGKRLFLLNPPADPSTDTDAEERATVAAIIAAVEGSGLEKIVAESTYGAQPGERCGDLNVLFEMEQALKSQAIPTSIIRAAYYMSNWDASLDTVRKRGVLDTMLPADFKLPMVAPKDLGSVAARLLTEPAEHTGLHYVEGPERYSANDVAAAFAKAVGQPVEVAATPREEWKDAFKRIGFSEAAAKSYERMTAATLEAPAAPDCPVRGTVSLQDYVSALVERDGGDAPK